MDIKVVLINNEILAKECIYSFNTLYEESLKTNLLQRLIIQSVRNILPGNTYVYYIISDIHYFIFRISTNSMSYLLNCLDETEIICRSIRA